MAGKFQLPEAEDYHKSIIAILRIQDVYQYTVEELINEVYAESEFKPYRPINGKPVYEILGRQKAQLDRRSFICPGHDCLEIAKFTFDRWDNYHAILWFQEAERLLEPLGKANNKAIFVELYDLLSEALYRVRRSLCDQRV